MPATTRSHSARRRGRGDEASPHKRRRKARSLSGGGGGGGAAAPPAHVGDVSDAGWHAAAPPRKARAAMAARCGTACFLAPSSNGFPVCDADCRVDCRGVRAAEARATQYGHAGIAAAARALGAREGCAWARGGKSGKSGRGGSPKKK